MENSPIPGVVKKALPAVVSITVSKMLPVFGAPFSKHGRNSAHPGYKLPPEQLLVPKGKKEVKVGGGSGFVVDPSGIILTNRHVVADPQADYVVILDEEERYPAEVVARDPVNDIAIIKIDAKDLPTIEMGTSLGLELGHTAIAIGNALGNFLNTVSVGVISGLSREITAGDVTTKKTTKLRGLIQTDAAINPGNSGGPLIDINGKVVGINTAMVFMAENIGFALPIDNAKKVLEDLKKYGRIRYPFLGIRYILLDKEVQDKFKLPVDHGALVVAEPGPGGQAVLPGGAADKAGVKEGDIILEIAGEEVCSKKPLEEIVQNCQIGEKISIKILRGDKTINSSAVLAERN